MRRVKPVSPNEVRAAFAELAPQCAPPSEESCAALAALLNLPLPADDNPIKPTVRDLKGRQVDPLAALKLIPKLRDAFMALAAQRASDKATDDVAWIQRVDYELYRMLGHFTPPPKPRLGWHVRAVDLAAVIRGIMVTDGCRPYSYALALGRTASTVALVAWGMTRVDNFSAKTDHKPVVSQALKKYLLPPKMPQGGAWRYDDPSGKQKNSE
jgi:hypothetical protein